MNWTESTSSEPMGLSAAGRRRRDEMRRMLVEEAVRHGRRRRQRRTARWASGFVLLVVAGVWSVRAINPLGSAVKPSGPAVTVAPEPVERSAPIKGNRTLARVIVVGNDMDAIRTQRVQTRVDASAVSISDDELLATLAQMGRRTGIARIGGRVILTQPVTDADLSRARNDDVDSEKETEMNSPNTR